ncbi:hypothetical protein V8C34DRAFT_301524 [Trichoderma compactum]
MESSSSNSSPIDRLRMTIEHTKTSPLTITSTVVNENTQPVTFLLYDSPLDTLAPTIGLLIITPDGALQPLELPEIQASIVLKGHWDMVWAKQKDDITVDMIEQGQAQPNPDVFTGSFATEGLEITTV